MGDNWPCARSRGDAGDAVGGGVDELAGVGKASEDLPTPGDAIPNHARLHGGNGSTVVIEELGLSRPTVARCTIIDE